jgi:hypothetical protein
MSEVTVILKDASRTHKQTFLIPTSFTVSPDDPVILMCKDTAMKDFSGHVERIQVRIEMDLD